MTITAEMIERAAKALCELDGHDAEYLEPGNMILHPLDDLILLKAPDGVFIDFLCDSGVRPPDGYEGEPCHFLWREYIEKAQVALRAGAGVAG